MFSPFSVSLLQSSSSQSFRCVPFRLVRRGPWLSGIVFCWLVLLFVTVGCCLVVDGPAACDIRFVLGHDVCCACGDGTLFFSVMCLRRVTHRGSSCLFGPRGLDEFLFCMFPSLSRQSLLCAIFLYFFGSFSQVFCAGLLRCVVPLMDFLLFLSIVWVKSNDVA